MTATTVAAWVAASRKAQGLPEHVEDATVLARVADLVADTPAPENAERVA
jgi:hypothetical protein